MYAYDKSYLDDSMKNMGEMMDYATSICDMDGDEFLKLFIACGIAAQFETGTPKVVSGMSGTELALEVFSKTGMDNMPLAPQEEYVHSASYWGGWILAYYQWYTRRSFKNTLQQVSFKEIEKLYPTLHEAAEEKFVDTVNSMIRRKKPATRLQLQRKACGYTQKTLSEKSEVNLRTLQQYEMRAKDINKAGVETVAALASVLGCRIEDLLEFDIGEIGD